MTIDNLLNVWRATVAHLRVFRLKHFRNLCPVGKDLLIRRGNALPPMLFLTFLLKGGFVS